MKSRFFSLESGMHVVTKERIIFRGDTTEGLVTEVAQWYRPDDLKALFGKLFGASDSLRFASYVQTEKPLPIGRYYQGVPDVYDSPRYGLPPKSDSF